MKSWSVPPSLPPGEVPGCAPPEHHPCHPPTVTRNLANSSRSPGASATWGLPDRDKTAHLVTGPTTSAAANLLEIHSIVAVATDDAACCGGCGGRLGSRPPAPPRPRGEPERGV